MINKILEPKSIAIIGASRDENSECVLGVIRMF
jgi:acyl-CoA synthetase (NDP forming)